MRNETALEQNFWQDLEEASREVDAWPEWKKSYRINIFSEPLPEKKPSASNVRAEKTRK